MNCAFGRLQRRKLILRHPEASARQRQPGILDQATDVVRNLKLTDRRQLQAAQPGQGFTVSGLVGNQINAFRSNTDGLYGQQFYDPNFVSVNNAATRTNFTTLNQRRLVSPLWPGCC
jgi:hypothetical protein